MAKEQPKLIAKIIFNEEAKNPNNAYARSANTGAGYKGMFMKADYKKYKERFQQAAKEVAPTTPYGGHIKIISHWTFGTRRKKDLQNCGKLEYDALNDIIYNDDSQIVSIECNKYYKKKEPSIVIEVWSHPDGDTQWPEA